MDENTLTRLLRGEGAEAEVPGRNCPDEALLSAYVEHGIPEEERAKVEAHLADCEACLGQVAFLASQPAEPSSAVAPGAVARARGLVALPPSPWRSLVLRWGTALAGVACVVLVAIAVLRPGGPMQAPATMPVPDVAAGTPSASAPEQPAAVARRASLGATLKRSEASRFGKRAADRPQLGSRGSNALGRVSG